MRDEARAEQPLRETLIAELRLRGWHQEQLQASRTTRSFKKGRGRAGRRAKSLLDAVLQQLIDEARDGA